MNQPFFALFRVSQPEVAHVRHGHHDFGDGVDASNHDPHHTHQADLAWLLKTVLIPKYLSYDYFQEIKYILNPESTF